MSNVELYRAETDQRLRLKKVAKDALLEYGLVDSRMRLVGSTHNFVYRVAARQRRARKHRQYALRIHAVDWHTVEAIESEMMWLDAIRRETDFVAPQPLMSCRGRLLVEVSCGDELRIGTLFHWIPGRRFWKKPSQKWLHKIGRLMEALQSHGRTFSRPRGFQRPRWSAAEMIGRSGALSANWGNLPKQMVGLFQEVSGRFEKAAEEIGTSADSFGLIHADLHVANVLSQGGVAVAIDFDDCCDGFYLADIAATIDFLEFRSNYRALREAFLSGYQHRRPLLAEHLRHVNGFLAARWVMLCLFFAGRPQDRARLLRTAQIVVPKLRRFLRQPDCLG